MHKNSHLWLIFAVTIAISISWIHYQWRHQQKLTLRSDPSRIDYYLSNVSLLATNSQGQLKYHLKATHLTHNLTTKHSEIINPFIKAIQQDSLMTMQANKAVQRLKGDIELSGKVAIKKNESQSIEGFQLNTQTIIYSPNQQLLQTKNDFTIKTNRGNIVTGIGLIEDLKNNTLRIKSNVRATIIPNHNNEKPSIP